MKDLHLMFHLQRQIICLVGWSKISFPGVFLYFCIIRLQKLMITFNNFVKYCFSLFNAEYQCNKQKLEHALTLTKKSFNYVYKYHKSYFSSVGESWSNMLVSAGEFEKFRRCLPPRQIFKERKSIAYAKSAFCHRQLLPKQFSSISWFSWRQKTNSINVRFVLP